MQKTPNIALRKQNLIVHSVTQGVLGTVSLIIGSTRFFREIIGSLIASILSCLYIEAEYSTSLQIISVEISDGSILSFNIQEAFSGFLTTVLFIIIYIFTIGLVQERLIKKISWLFSGIIVTIIWNINRFFLSIFMSLVFGTPVFSIINYLFGPFADALLIVSLWSLALSKISREKRG